MDARAGIWRGHDILHALRLPLWEPEEEGMSRGLEAVPVTLKAHVNLSMPVNGKIYRNGKSQPNINTNRLYLPVYYTPPQRTISNPLKNSTKIRWSYVCHSMYLFSLR